MSIVPAAAMLRHSASIRQGVPTCVCNSGYTGNGAVCNGKTQCAYTCLTLCHLNYLHGAIQFRKKNALLQLSKTFVCTRLHFLEDFFVKKSKNWAFNCATIVKIPFRDGKMSFADCGSLYDTNLLCMSSNLVHRIRNTEMALAV